MFFGSWKFPGDSGVLQCLEIPFVSFGEVIKQGFYRTASFKVIGWRGIETFLKMPSEED